MTPSIPAASLALCEPTAEGGVAAAAPGAPVEPDSGFADALLALLGGTGTTAAGATGATVAPATSETTTGDAPTEDDAVALALLIAPGMPLPARPDAATLLAMLGQRGAASVAATMGPALFAPALGELTADALGAAGDSSLQDPVAGLLQLAVESADPAVGLGAALNREIVDAALAIPESDDAVPDTRAAPGVELSQPIRPQHEAAPRSTAPAVQAQVGTPQWSQEFSARVSWIVDRGDQTASIRLSPEDLGPVEVRVAIREGEASIWFGAAHAETRHAIEQAIPRLREMLSASGLSLADAGVFKQAPRDPQRGFVRADALRARTEVAASQEIAIALRPRGLIDDYA